MDLQSQNVPNIKRSMTGCVGHPKPLWAMLAALMGDTKTPSCMNLHGCFRKWWYPQIIHFNRVFHYKPSIWGNPIFGNTHMSGKFLMLFFLFCWGIPESRNLFIAMCRGALLVTYLLFIDFGIARKKTLPRHPHRLSKLWSNMARQKISTFCLNVL